MANINIRELRESGGLSSLFDNGSKGGGGKARFPSTTDATGSCSTTNQIARRNLVKPFVIASAAVIAAGAQAINTTLFDAFLAANVDFIAANNVFPYDVETYGCCWAVSTNLAATYIEVQALMVALYVVESDQTGELARWPIMVLGLVLATEGVVTSGAVAHSSYYGPGVFQPWPRYYPNGSTQFLTVQTTLAFTSVGPINISATLPARR